MAGDLKNMPFGSDERIQEYSDRNWAADDTLYPVSEEASVDYSGESVELDAYQVPYGGESVEPGGNTLWESVKSTLPDTRDVSGFLFGGAAAMGVYHFAKQMFGNKQAFTNEELGRASHRMNEWYSKQKDVPSNVRQNPTDPTSNIGTKSIGSGRGFDAFHGRSLNVTGTDMSSMDRIITSRVGVNTGLMEKRFNLRFDMSDKGALTINGHPVNKNDFMKIINNENFKNLNTWQKVQKIKGFAGIGVIEKIQNKNKKSVQNILREKGGSGSKGGGTVYRGGGSAYGGAAPWGDGMNTGPGKPKKGTRGSY